MEKKKVVHELAIMFWLFVIGSFLGYIYEMIVVLFKKGFFESRQGLIYGPFTPVYGIGAIVYYLTLNAIEKRSMRKTNETALCDMRHARNSYLIKVFIITAILGGITEYVSSYVQEKVFGTISWDYSYLIFDLNGRTSLKHCMYWGTAGILYVTFVIPLLKKLRIKIEANRLKIATIALSIFMAFNIVISCTAAERQKERRESIEARGAFDTFLDTYYPDEYLNKIFANKKDV